MGGVFRQPIQVGGLYLPGVSGNYASTPDTADLDITGDLDLRARIQFEDYNTGSNMSLVAKWDFGGDRSYDLRLNSGGVLRLEWSTDGAATSGQNGGTITGVATNGAAIWVRATLDADDGGVAVVRFYTSTDGVTWTQLGSDNAQASTVAIYSGAALLTVGARTNNGSNSYATGIFHEAQVLDGIAGTTVANPVFKHPETAWTSDGVTMHDGDRLWTINGDQFEWRA